MHPYLLHREVWGNRLQMVQLEMGKYVYLIHPTGHLRLLWLVSWSTTQGSLGQPLTNVAIWYGQNCTNKVTLIFTTGQLKALNVVSLNHNIVVWYGQNWANNVTNMCLTCQLRNLNVGTLLHREVWVNRLQMVQLEMGKIGQTMFL
jgi:hypothetical protein